MEYTRCPWAKTPAEIRYHDEEWGRPLHDDRALFELLILEGMQAGVSWNIILQKREAFRQAFDNFEPRLVAAYDESKLEELMGNPGILRNRTKLRCAIFNAAAFLRVQEEFGSFDRYLWQWVDGVPIVNHPQSMADLPAKTPLSEAVSADLRKRGFKFVGAGDCLLLSPGRRAGQRPHGVVSPSRPNGPLTAFIYKKSNPPLVKMLVYILTKEGFFLC